MAENQTATKDAAKSVSKTNAAASSRRSTGAEDTVDAILLRLESFRESTADGTYVLGVTSCGRRSGVSTIVGKLAVRAAEMSLGRVLLIDANLDFPKQARHFGLKRKAGLAEAVLGEGELSDKFFNGAVDGLHVMPAGAPFKRKLNVSPDACGSVMKELRQEFPLVFVDLPPITDSARFLMFARQTDGLALIIDAKSTRARAVHAALQTLEGSGVNVIGSILNRKARTLPKWLDRWV